MELENEIIELPSIGELVRQAETDYTRGSITISEYVTYDMYNTINVIEAYLNSKHTSGEFDSLGREKPFFNIVIAAANIWFRSTDIDRKQIRVRPTTSMSVVNAFLATILIQDWMRRENFGQFLNEWGRVLSRYGSASLKFTEKDDRLIPSVTPWNRMIVDPIDYDNNLKIEVIEMTEAQLRKHTEYDQEAIKNLCAARKVRETLKKKKKDNKSEYIKIYELHGELPLYYLTEDEADADKYVQMMKTITFDVGPKKGDDEKEYVLYEGRERIDPNMITHLIKEDGRTLSIGAVEHLFQSQWMLNHTTKAIKDQLDLASKLIFQTDDINFTGQNALQAIETGDVLIHAKGSPVSVLNNNSHDIASLQSYRNDWKNLGNEINGISEAMLGVTPPSGTAWRQVDALLNESHSLFEMMTENKGLYVVQMFTDYIIPHIKKKLKNSKQIAAILEENDIQFVDSRYLSNKSIQKANDKVVRDVLNLGRPTMATHAQEMMKEQSRIQSELSDLGTQRFFKPDEIDDTTWKETLFDLEWTLEVDVTDENVDREAATTINSMLQFLARKQGQPLTPEEKLLVGKMMNLTGTVSPLELSSVTKTAPTPAALPAPMAGGGVGITR